MIMTFIGGGNMATAIIQGLLDKGTAASKLRVVDPSEDARRRLVEQFGISAHAEPREAVPGAEVVILATKPQVMKPVFAALEPLLQPAQLVLSIAAGVTLEAMAAALGRRQPLVRSMPNTPALLGRGVSGLVAGEYADRGHRAAAERILQACGTTVWVDDEALMDVVTAVSGSGPAYFFLMIEALRDAGARLGLPDDVATLLAAETARGAGEMACRSDDDVAVLRERVTSPGGTTAAALEVLEDGRFREWIGRAVDAATARGRALGAEAAGQPDE